jgi:hypothetical protein
MTLVRALGLAAIAATALCASPALATRADGAWECHSFGALIATLGFDGNGYIYANPNGPSGKGEISYNGDDMFVVTSGPLVDSTGIVGGILKEDNGEPMLELQNVQGERLACYGK